MWSVWDKKSNINGFSADFVLDRHKHLKSEKIIFIKTMENGRVAQIEGKSILASISGVDESLSNEAFIAEHERIISESIVYEEVTI